MLNMTLMTIPTLAALLLCRKRKKAEQEEEEEEEEEMQDSDMTEDEDVEAAQGDAYAIINSQQACASLKQISCAHHI